MTDEPRPDPCAEMRVRYREHQRAYQRERRRAFDQRPDVKERRRAYDQRPEVRERKREYQQRPEVKARKRAYDQQRRAPATITCAACGRTTPPAETDAGALACMHCGGTEVR